MCDIAAERAKIDLLLLDSLREAAGEGSERLSEVGMRKLLEHYGDACPDQCVARRVEAFVEAVVAGAPPYAEHASDHVSDHAGERGRARACG